MLGHKKAGRRYWKALVVAQVILWVLALALTASLVGAGRVAADLSGRAGLVVSFGDGTTVTRCIGFTGEEISGIDLLQASGLPLVISDSSMGSAVCQIGDVGCGDPNDCFCQCRGDECLYWAYYHLGEDGAWHYSSVGASQHRLRDGDVDGWAWGARGPMGGALPDLYSFHEICAPPATSTPTRVPTVVATATPTRTPAPAATATAPPTVSPALTVVSTASPTPMPAATATATPSPMVSPALTVVSTASPTSMVPPPTDTPVVATATPAAALTPDAEVAGLVLAGTGQGSAGRGSALPIAGAIAAACGAILFVAGGWYARRRWGR